MTFAMVESSSGNLECNEIVCLVNEVLTIVPCNMIFLQKKNMQFNPLRHERNARLLMITFGSCLLLEQEFNYLCTPKKSALKLAELRSLQSTDIRWQTEISRVFYFVFFSLFLGIM